LALDSIKIENLQHNHPQAVFVTLGHAEKLRIKKKFTAKSKKSNKESIKKQGDIKP
jgi:hypothetical protein